VHTEQLRAAYEDLTAEAAAGGFGPPPAGEWNAAQILAHLALNDTLLAGTIEQVLAGDAAAFDNTEAADWAKVTAYAEEHGGLTGTAEALRGTGRRVCELAGRITAEQAARTVPVFIRDGDEIAVDQPFPLGQLLGLQASFHLPAHADQLRALRPGAGGA
jgi:hypothetical protein